MMVIKGSNLAFGPAPETERDIRNLREAGFCTIVNIGKGLMEREEDVARKVGMDYYEIRLNTKVRNDALVLYAVLRRIENAMERGTVYLHCNLGVCRSPFVAASFVYFRHFSKVNIGAFKKMAMEQGMDTSGFPKHWEQTISELGELIKSEVVEPI